MNISRTQVLLSVPLTLVVFGAIGWLARDMGWLAIYQDIGTLAQTWQTYRHPALFLLTAILAIDLLCLYPYRLLETFLTGVFGGNIRALTVVMASAVFLVVIVTWLRIIYYILLLLTATLLLRLDLHELRYSRWQSFGLILICQTAGLGLGWMGNVLLWRGLEYWQRHFPLAL
jgi:hypothetical protein